MIVLDISQFVPPGAADRLPEILRAVIPDLADATRNELVRLAGERLTTSAEDYVQGLGPAQYHMPTGKTPDEFVGATIVLTGWLANAAEHGWAGGDMKPWLLSGRAVHEGKRGGRWVVVPFRHGTPGTSGRNFQAMGSQYVRGFKAGPQGFIPTGSLTQAQAQKLGKQIHRAAKQLAATTSHATTGTVWGGRLPAGLAPKLEPHHKTDPFAGMVRQEKTYRKATQNQYTTFRAVSLRSDPRAWVHPGIQGHNLFGAVEPFVGRTASALFAMAVRQLGAG